MSKYGNSREVFSFDTRDVLKAQMKLASLGDNANLILSRAVNRSLSNVSKNMRKQVVDRYHVKPMRVGKTIRVTRKASVGNPTAHIRSIGRHITLTSFQMTPRRSPKRLKSGKYSPPVYEAAVRKDRGLRRLAGNPKPFIQRVNNGNVISVRRISEDSRKLEGVYGPAVPQMLKNQEILSIINHDAEIMMSKRVTHELDRLLK